MADAGVDLAPRAARSRPGTRPRAAASASRSRAHPDRLHPGQDRDERQLDLAEQAVEALPLEGGRQRLAGGDRRERLETGPGERRQLGGRRQDQVELLGDDVGDRLAAQAGVEDVGRDLGVEVHRRAAVAAGVSDDAAPRGAASPRGRRSASPSRSTRRTEPGRVVGPVDGDRPTVEAGHGHRQGGPGQRPRVVEDERRADGSLLREPGLEAVEPLPRRELDPTAGIGDRGRQRRRQVAGRLDGTGPTVSLPGPAARRDRGPRPGRDRRPGPRTGLDRRRSRARAGARSPPPRASRRADRADRRAAAGRGRVPSRSVDRRPGRPGSAPRRRPSGAPRPSPRRARR